MITQAQELFLRMLELTQVNNLDGSRVARDLRANEHVWRSVLFVRVGIRHGDDGKVRLAQSPMDLLALRDLHKGDLHCDTLLVLPEPGHKMMWKGSLILGKRTRFAGLELRKPERFLVAGELL